MPGNSKNGRNGKLTRRIHAFLGIVSALNLFVLITTGFLLQHASLLRLDERTVSRAVLPRSYRPQDGESGVRADIFVTDLHSGRLIGTAGTLLLDGLTLVWITLLITGLVMYAGKERAKQRAAENNESSDSEE